MRILQLTKKVPYPIKDGESIAVNQLSKGLVGTNCTIDLLSFNTIKHFVGIDNIAKGLSHYQRTQTVYLDNRVKVLPALLNLFSSKSYNISRFDTSDYRNKLILLLKKGNYDIVILESLYMCPYIDVIKQYSQAKIVLRSHNIEYKIWERLAANEKKLFKRAYLRLLSNRLKSYEISNLDHYDLLVSISTVDESVYRNIHPYLNILTVPTGMDVSNIKKANSIRGIPLRLFFLGSLDWEPNIEGLRWFINEVWSSIDCEVELHIAGRNCPKWLMNLNTNGIIVHGEIEDAHRYIRTNDIMIVPLFSGSGIRIKILESMAIGKVVITTTIGMEGISATVGKEILRADTKSEYITIIKSIVEAEIDLPSISKAGIKFIDKYFNQKNISLRLYEELNLLSSGITKP